jgi:hypothetical protein
VKLGWIAVAILDDLASAELTETTEAELTDAILALEIEATLALEADARLMALALAGETQEEGPLNSWRFTTAQSGCPSMAKGISPLYMTLLKFGNSEPRGGLGYALSITYCLTVSDQYSPCCGNVANTDVISVVWVVVPKK